MSSRSLAGKRRLTIACGLYDRTRALLQGDVPIEGVEPTFLAPAPAETFWRNIRYHEFDVAEMSFATYIMMRAQRVDDFIAVPVFPARAFRHSAIYVRADSPYTHPEELRGQRLGIATYEQTVGLFVRGLLADEYGLMPEQFRWVTWRGERVAYEPPAGIHIEPVSREKVRSLDDLLMNGEITAYIAPRWPRVSRASVRRLFLDVHELERDYYRRTQIFPIMHCVVLRRALHDECPWLASTVCKAFHQAKMHLYRDFDDYLKWSLPWFAEYVAKSREWMGADIWPYGVEHNRATLEAATRYAFEQRLTPQRQSLDELFVEGRWSNEELATW